MIVDKINYHQVIINFNWKEELFFLSFENQSPIA